MIMSLNSHKGVPPVFLMMKNIPERESVNEYTICKHSAYKSGRDSILGCQRIGALFRIYTRTAVARATLLATGIDIGGKNIELKHENPFLVRGSDGQEIEGTRLTISDVPLPYSNEEIENALIRKGLKLRSKLNMEKIRDPHGKMTEWLSGRRFVWIDLPKTTIESTLTMGPFKAKLYYKEMKVEQQCRRCLEKGHTSSQCTKDEVCFHCRNTGHKAAHCPDKKNPNKSPQKSFADAFPLLSSRHDEVLDPSDDDSWEKVSGKKRLNKQTGRRYRTNSSMSLNNSCSLSTLNDNSPDELLEEVDGLQKTDGDKQLKDRHDSTGRSLQSEEEDKDVYLSSTFIVQEKEDNTEYVSPVPLEQQVSDGRQYEGETKTKTNNTTHNQPHTNDENMQRDEDMHSESLHSEIAPTINESQGDNLVSLKTPQKNKKQNNKEADKTLMRYFNFVGVFSGNKRRRPDTSSSGSEASTKM